MSASRSILLATMRCIYCVKIKLLEHCITARFPLFVFGCSFLIKNMYICRNIMQKLRFKNMLISYYVHCSDN